MNIRKKLTPQLILDDLEGQYYEIRLQSECREPEPKEKNGCFSVFSRCLWFFRF